MAEMKIGRVATLVGVGIDTVRYYERRGLLPAAPRRASGYRIFDETTVERIKLIKQLQDLGLSLLEIDAMLRATGEHATCAHESDKIRAALARTHDKIAALTKVKQQLKAALGRCERGECTLLVQMSKVGQGNAVAAHKRPNAASDAARRPKDGRQSSSLARAAGWSLKRRG